MTNVEKSFDYDDDSEWIYEAAQPYYLGVCLFLVFFTDFYLLSFLYAFFGVCLIWQDEDEEKTELDIMTMKKRLLYLLWMF